MTAEEMFKKEGYEKLTEDNLRFFIDENDTEDSLKLSLKYNIVTYIKKTNTNTKEISFTSNYNVNVFEQWKDGELTDINLSSDLLEAIIKQLKEFEN